MRMKIQFDLKAARRLVSREAKKAIDAAGVRSINEVVRMASTKEVRELSQEVGSAQKGIRAKMRILKATRSKMVATLVGRGETPNLIRFDAKKTKAGVSAKVWAGGRRRTFRGAFIGNQGRTVFRRTGQGRGIEPVHGPSVGRAWARKKVDQRVNKTVEENWPRIFTRNYKYQMQRLRSRK